MSGSKQPSSRNQDDIEEFYKRNQDDVEKEYSYDDEEKEYKVDDNLIEYSRNNVRGKQIHEDVETNVILGFVDDEDEEEESFKPTYKDSFLGGKPVWLNDKSVPPKNFVQCDYCNKWMTLLLQLNAAPFEFLDQFYDRVLYLFVCQNSSCQKSHKAGAPPAKRGTTTTALGFGQGAIKCVRGIMKNKAIEKQRQDAVLAQKKAEKEKREAAEREKLERQKKLESEKIRGEDIFGKKSEGASNPFAVAGSNPFATAAASSSPFAPAAVTSANPFAIPTIEKKKEEPIKKPAPAKKVEKDEKKLTYAEIASSKTAKQTNTVQVEQEQQEEKKEDQEIPKEEKKEEEEEEKLADTITPEYSTDEFPSFPICKYLVTEPEVVDADFLNPSLNPSKEDDDSDDDDEDDGDDDDFKGDEFKNFKIDANNSLLEAATKKTLQNEDKAFAKFCRLVSQNPEQVIRYYRFPSANTEKDIIKLASHTSSSSSSSSENGTLEYNPLNFISYNPQRAKQELGTLVDDTCLPVLYSSKDSLATKLLLPPQPDQEEGAEPATDPYYYFNLSIPASTQNSSSSLSSTTAATTKQKSSSSVYTINLKQPQAVLRTVEFQVMPHIISYLEGHLNAKEILSKGMEWGTIYVATPLLENLESLKFDANGVAYSLEWVGIQWE